MYVVLSWAILILALGSSVPLVGQERGYLRARRKGVELQADVVENAPHAAGQRNNYWLAPVVRYHLDGHKYLAEVSNASGRPGDTGGSMTVLVHPDEPGVPYDRYGGIGMIARNSLGLCLLAAGNFVIMLLTRR
jgi:hypothetical protein